MQIEEAIVRNKEKAILNLRSLYHRYGYSCFKINKFEEYDLYSLNKDFLLSENIITFNNTNGKLVALKPDVTLSIAKNFRPIPGFVQRVYYNENVYRVVDKNDGFKEIMQVGIESLGDITRYNLCEVLQLSVMSLAAISDDSVLNISHLGVIGALIDTIEDGKKKKEIAECVGEKNPHGIKAICEECQVAPEITQALSYLTEAYGDPNVVIPRLREITNNEKVSSSLDDLEDILRNLEPVDGVRIQVDFGLTSNMNYYNGLLFNGYIKGLPTHVLSGGQYDNLLSKMGKHAGTIGFAVYLDQLDRLDKRSKYDGDILLLYDDDADAGKLLSRVRELTADGKRVIVQRTVPDKLSFADVEKFKEEE